MGQPDEDYEEETLLCCPPCIAPAIFGACMLLGGVLLALASILARNVDTAPLITLQGGFLNGNLQISLWSICYTSDSASEPTCTQPAFGLTLDNVTLASDNSTDLSQQIEGLYPTWTTTFFFSHPACAAVALLSQLVWLIAFLFEDSELWFITCAPAALVHGPCRERLLGCYSDRNRNLPALWLGVAAFVCSIMVALADSIFYTTVIKNASDKSLDSSIGQLFGIIAGSGTCLIWAAFIAGLFFFCSDPPDNIDANEWKSSSIAIPNQEVHNEG